MSFKFTDVCFITNNVLRIRAFYETVLGVEADGIVIDPPEKLSYTELGLQFIDRYMRTETFP